jgi:hypothetical protein
VALGTGFKNVELREIIMEINDLRGFDPPSPTLRRDPPPPLSNAIVLRQSVAKRRMARRRTGPQFSVFYF